MKGKEDSTHGSSLSVRNFVAAKQPRPRVGENMKTCPIDTTGMSQETADFSDCVGESVVTNYGTPYDFTSIMQYELDS